MQQYLREGHLQFPIFNCQLKGNLAAGEFDFVAGGVIIEPAWASGAILTWDRVEPSRAAPQRCQFNTKGTKMPRIFLGESAWNLRATIRNLRKRLMIERCVFAGIALVMLLGWSIGRCRGFQVPDSRRWKADCLRPTARDARDILTRIKTGTGSTWRSLSSRMFEWSAPRALLAP